MSTISTNRRMAPVIAAALAVLGALAITGLTPGSASAQATSTPTRTPTRTATPACPLNYTVTATSGATVVPGTTLIPDSDRCDDCTFVFNLPFAYTFYDQSNTSIEVSDNGQLFFNPNPVNQFIQTCLPDLQNSRVIYAHWMDLTIDRTEVLECEGYCGIYTSVSGSAPNRILNIEWRAVEFNTSQRVKFEVRLYEGQQKYDVIYGTVSIGTALSTIGAQRNLSTFVEYQSPCNPGLVSLAGTKLTFTYSSICPTSTPTDIPTETPTRTATPTRTHTPTNVPASTATATQQAGVVVVVGHVLLEGRGAPPNPSWIVPVTLETRLGSNPVATFNTVTDPNGYFTVTIGTTPGTYQWRVKDPLTLANSGSAALVAGINNIEMGTLRAGDAVENNCVEIDDFNALKGTFGRSSGQPGYDGRADFDGTGTVDVNDFSLLKAYFGFCGAPALGTATATPTPPLGVVVVGHVLLEGRGTPPNPSWIIPVTLTLKLGTGSPTTYAATTDASGYFTVATATGPGTYQWRVKNSKMLANSGSATLAAGINNIEMGTLRAGDAVENNCVDIDDFNALKGTFGRSAGDPGYDARADFDGNNTVDVSDFSLLKTYFGFCGAPPLVAELRTED